MTDYLLYWKTFWFDVDEDFSNVEHDWHTNNKDFYNNVEKEDILWVVTNGGIQAPNEWRLISRSVVAGRDPIVVRRNHFFYHIVGDEERSVFFDPTWQDDFAPILKQLNFKSGSRVKVSGKLIGRTLQIARRLTDKDVEIILNYARTLVIGTGEKFDIGSSLRPAALAEDGYFRVSPQKFSFILREHNKLSNDFAAWLEAEGYLHIKQEQDFIDVVFDEEGISYRAELKVCSGVGSTKVIREAIGQLLEYNFYPGREQADRWVIILDRRATNSDIEYVLTLKESLGLPLCLGWREKRTFVFADGLELEDE
jgi:hypothetical protein